MSQALYKIDVGSIKNIFLVLSLFSRSAQHTMVRPPMFEIPLKLSCRPGLLVYLFREQCSCRGQLRLSSKFLLWRGVFVFAHHVAQQICGLCNIFNFGLSYTHLSLFALPSFPSAKYLTRVLHKIMVIFPHRSGTIWGPNLQNPKIANNTLLMMMMCSQLFLRAPLSSPPPN